MKTPILLLFTLLAMMAGAESPVPRPDGWITLFDGKDLSAFTDAGGKPTKWTVDQAALRGDDKHGDIWTKAVFGNFVLEIEFKTTGNSGVFFRTANPKDPVETGIEIQVDNPGGPNVHSVGAIYDLVAPRQNAAKAGEWNTYRITAKGPEISVELNGIIVAEMNLDRWTEAGKNPDGTPNKYRNALKDFARSGHIGFQDHGHAVWYRNIRVKPLP